MALRYCAMYPGNVVSSSSVVGMSENKTIAAFDHEDTSLPRYICIRLPSDVASYLGRKESSAAPQRKPQISSLVALNINQRNAHSLSNFNSSI
jgi:hypothetical protein